MIRKCIVHYGIHKTGTSSIQRTLQKNLKGSRFYYLNLNGSGNHSAPIQKAFLKPKDTGNVVKSSGSVSETESISLAERYRSSLIGELDKVEDRVALISGESISVMSKDSLVSFRKTLTHYFDEIELVGYVRSPGSFIDSAFQQVVKGGTAHFELEKFFPEYRKKFSRLESVFGRENIRYWKFDPKNFVSGCVVTDFCTRLGIDLDFDKVIRVNESLSLPALKLLFIYRKFSSQVGAVKVSPYENSLLLDALSKLDGPKLKFHSKVLNPIIKENRDAIRWMEKRLGTDLREQRLDSRKSIGSEEDLLSVGQLPVKWLSSRLGMEFEQSGTKGLSLLTIADWMNRYQQQLISK